MITYTQFDGQNVRSTGPNGNKASFVKAMLSIGGKSETEANSNFGEDFMQEHCLSDASEARKAVSGCDLHDCPQAFGFPC